MISTQQLKNVIETKLNELASQLPFEFLIHASMGDLKTFREQGQRELPKPLVNGVLVNLPSSIVPLQGIKSYTATQILTILAPERPDEPQGGIGDVLNLLQTFIENQAGLTGYLIDDDQTRYSYICAPQLPQVGQLGLGGIGFWHIPISISLTWQFIAGGVISNSIKLKIDGVDAILTDGSFVRTRIAQTNNKSNSQEMKTVIGQQGLTVKAIIPFMSNGNDSSIKLVQNLLFGSLDTVYQVEYNDGMTKLPNGQNPSWQMVATEITTNIAVGTVVSLTVTFVIADGQVYQEGV